MSALISPEIKKQYLTTSGAPLVGGKLYIYEAGTTTPATSYTTEAATVPNSNPIILDSRGETGGVFLNAGSYKFVLDDSSDVNLWSVDNVTVRDVGSELDAISLTVTSLNTSIEGSIDNTRVVSGVKSSNSSRARYLVPIGTANQVKVLATATPLVYIVQGISNTISADFVASGLASPPTTNNTALINDSNLSGQDYTKNLGEDGTVIPLDTIGSEFTSRNKQRAAFKVVGSATGYLIARIDTDNSCLTHAERGIFYDKDGNAIERVTLSDNDIITLMRLTYIYLTNSGTIIASYTDPVSSATEPTSSSDGDMWYDIVNEKWKRFNSTAYSDANCAYIGICITDESGNTVGARPDDFHYDSSVLNSFVCKYVDGATVESVSRSNCISVGATTLTFSDAPKKWVMTDDLESGEVEAASTTYHGYIMENGNGILSPHAKINQKGSLKGYYHPYETWRWVFSIDNNSSSNFTIDSLVNSDDGGVIDQIPIKKLTTNGALGVGEKLVLVDATSGAVSVTLPPVSLAKGDRIRIVKEDSGTNTVTVDGYGAETINGIANFVLKLSYESLVLISDGSKWIILSEHFKRNNIYAKATIADFSAVGSLAKLNLTASSDPYSLINDSTDRFTVDRDGVYLFLLKATRPAGASNWQTWVYAVNGGATVVVGSIAPSASSGITSYSSFILELSKDDYVEIHGQTGTSTVSTNCEAHLISYHARG